MPSLHTAITVVMAFALWRVRRSLGIAGALYSLLMGFSLIYLGEHYLVDVLAGVALAIAVAVCVARYLAESPTWTAASGRGLHVGASTTAPGD
jgi:membrane-associated phospholipid phosphatase